MGRVREHNREVVYKAEYRANEMKVWASPLERKMQRMLDFHGIRYEAQKIFYIYAADGWIIRYYIADFYLPDSHIIIEVDGKFHDKQKQHDRDRTRTIEGNYPDVRVVRFTGKDLANMELMNRILRGMNS